jgi:hypothetical protein
MLSKFPYCVAKLPGRIVDYRGGNKVVWEYDACDDYGVVVWDLFPGEKRSQKVWLWQTSDFLGIRTAKQFEGILSDTFLQCAGLGC